MRLCGGTSGEVVTVWLRMFVGTAACGGHTVWLLFRSLEHGARLSVALALLASIPAAKEAIVKVARCVHGISCDECIGMTPNRRA